MTPLSRDLWHLPKGAYYTNYDRSSNLMLLHRMETSMGRLEGKTAVITGGTTGIGLASAKRFVAEGAFVYIFGRRQTELDAAVKAIGAGAKGVQGDISKPEDLDRLFATVSAGKGAIDVLFANAGLGNHAPLSAITAE